MPSRVQRQLAGLVSVKGLYLDILSRSAALSGGPRRFTGSFDDVSAQWRLDGDTNDGQRGVVLHQKIS